MPVIDVHNHIVPETFPPDPSKGATPAWPCMECDGGHATMMISGKPYRQFDARSWSAQNRRDFMDENGIDVQVLSPLPELLSYWLPSKVAAEMAKHVNGTIAAMIAFDPGRFMGLGMVPLQDPTAATTMLQELKQNDGFRGVQIGSNIDGVSPADPRFDEFWAAAAGLDMAVFVHGIKPTGTERLVGPEVMGPIVGVPLDTAMCVSSCISAGLLQKYPTLHIGFSHGGGAVGSIIDRFEHVWKLMPALRDAVPQSPIATLRQFYYDVLTFNADYVSYLVDLAGEDRIFIGTDYPAGGMGLMDPVAFVESLGLTNSALEKVKGGNAQRYLRL